MIGTSILFPDQGSALSRLVEALSECPEEEIIDCIDQVSSDWWRAAILSSDWWRAEILSCDWS